MSNFALLFKNRGFLLSSLLCLGLSGCSRDRNADDYRKEKVLAEMARLNNVSGTYVGELHSRDDGQSLGFVAIQLQADTAADKTPDGTRTEERPLLRTRVTYYGAQPLNLVFANASYDSTSGTVKSMVSVEKTDKTSHQIDLTGVIQGDRLQGSLEAFGYSEEGATFTAVKGAQIPQDSETPPPLQSVKKNYKGVYKSGNHGSYTPGLEILSNPNSLEEEFLELFLPIRNVRATLSLGPVGEVVFPEARWDLNAGKIQGTAVIGGDLNLTVLLKCQEKALPGAETGWSCDYSSSANQTTRTVDFSPSAGAPDEIDNPIAPIETFHLKGNLALPLTGAKSIHLALTYRPLARGEELLEHFADLKIIRVTLDFSRDVQVVFENAAWYFEEGRIKAETTVGTMQMVLECNGKRGFDAPNQAWDCRYTTSVQSAPQNIRFAPMPRGQSPIPGPDRPIKYAAQGSVALPYSGSRNLALQLESRMPTKDEQMAEYFLNIKTVRATLTFSRNVQIVFENSRWNLQSGTLRGATNQYVDGQSVEFQLECTNLTPNTLVSSWSCRYSTSLKSAWVNMSLAPRSSPSLPPPPVAQEQYMRGSATLPTWGNRPVNVSWIKRAPTREQEMREYFKAIYTLRVTLVFSQNVQVVFENAEWNLDEGTIKGSMNLRSSGQDLTLVLDCLDEGSRNGQPNWACQYTTGLHDEPVLIRINQKSSRGAPIPSALPPFSQKYMSRHVSEDGDQQDLPIIVGTRPLSKEAEYYEFFRFVRIVRVAMTFGPDVTIVFDSAEWSQENRTLIGKTKALYGGQQADLTLECVESTPPEVRPPSWICDYTSSLRGLVAHMEWRPVPNEENGARGRSR